VIKIKVIDFEKYLKEYEKTTGLYPEELMQIGEKYHQKEYLTKEELYQLAHLNSTRSSYHVKKNPANRVEKVTEAAYQLYDDFCRLALYTSLMGIGTPTASAILTSLNPEKHCVIDTRVWASLYNLGYFEKEKESFKPDDYLKIIKIVREMAADGEFTTAEIGYALFAYDVVHREGNLH
jgi:thermostable 8-oxoguanine DNA glycosylase